jgi:4-diphosphocytidyl-2-C-methyl-D-erythritol kinase
VRVHAPAKINRSLEILGRRSDGYHTVRTELQSIALRDTITCTAIDGPMVIACDDPRCPTDESNLVWRAAEGVWRVAKRRGGPTGVRVALAKRVPMQAGLGGGSSDGAAALRALALFWRVRLSADSLHGLARELGADVPFFLAGGTALGAGRGDRLTALVDPPRQSIVIAVPPFGVAAADAYRWWDEDHGRAGPRGQAGNDLEGPVAARYPAIGRLARQLIGLGARHAAMSGSGSAVFGLFEGPHAAAAAGLALARGRLQVHVTRTLSRREYARLARPRWS